MVRIHGRPRVVSLKLGALVQSPLARMFPHEFGSLDDYGGRPDCNPGASARKVRFLGDPPEQCSVLGEGRVTQPV